MEVPLLAKMLMVANMNSLSVLKALNIGNSQHPEPHKCLQGVTMKLQRDFHHDLNSIYSYLLTARNFLCVSCSCDGLIVRGYFLAPLRAQFQHLFYNNDSM